MKLPDPFRPDGDHITIDLPGGRALFTTRRGGVSKAPFDSLNLGRTVAAPGAEDDPEAVAANRRILCLTVETAWEAVLRGPQRHGDRVAVNGDGGDADGQATSRRDRAALVLVADCVPIALSCEGAVAAVHAGWRGLAAGVIANGVAAVRELGPPGPIAAAIGPCAGACCLQVGEEVHARFTGVQGARSGDRLDMVAVARAQLRDSGVTDVHDTGLCTICSDETLFFSHRRDGERTGRQGVVVWRT